MKKSTLLFILSFLAIFGFKAQELRESKAFFDRLQVVDSLSGGKVSVFQDKRINRLFDVRGTGVGTPQKSGYRVQIFSSNEHKAGKDDAFKIEQELKKQFPEYAVYVNYSSPFWKVRMGDFETYEQAQAFRNKLIVLFSEYKNETYVVKDVVNL